MNAYNLMFIILAVLVMCSSIATVVTKSIVRAATYLLFVLLGTAGLYFLLATPSSDRYKSWYTPVVSSCLYVFSDSAHLGASRGTLLFAPLQDH